MKKIVFLALLFLVKQINAQCSITVSSVTICAGDSATLAASGVTTYTWMPSGVNTSTITVTPSITTIYTVTGTTGTCTATNTVIVTVNPTPTITVSPSNSIVYNGGSGMNLYAHGALTYTWTNIPPQDYLDTNGDSVYVNPSTMAPPSVFTYSVTGTATDGCVSLPVIVTVTVVAMPVPYYVANPDTICIGQHATLSVDSMPATATYTWVQTSPSGGLGSNSGSLVQATPIYNGHTDTTFHYQVFINIPGCPPYAPHTISVFVLDSSSCAQLGIETLNQTASTFAVYPNPSNGQITISLYDKAENIRIIDMQGRTVYETQRTDAGEFKLDISQYTKGIYFVMAKIGNTIEKQKLVVE